MISAELGSVPLIEKEPPELLSFWADFGMPAWLARCWLQHCRSRHSSRETRAECSSSSESSCQASSGREHTDSDCFCSEARISVILIKIIISYQSYCLELNKCCVVGGLVGWLWCDKVYKDVGSSLVSLVHPHGRHSPAQTVGSCPVRVVAVAATNSVAEPYLVGDGHHHLVTTRGSTPAVSQCSVSQSHPVPHHPCRTQNDKSQLAVSACN